MAFKNLGSEGELFPQSVFIIASYDEQGTPNAMNAAWAGECSRKEICFIFHRIAGHVKEIEFLKDSSLLSVKLIMADLVQQDNPAHDFMQIRFDEDKAVTFDNLIHTLLPVEVYSLDNNTKFFCNAFRISGSDFADYGIGTGDYGVGAVQMNQYPHLPSLVRNGRKPGGYWKN